jgi:hypothetical protein
MGVSYCLINTGEVSWNHKKNRKRVPPTTNDLPQEFSDLFKFDHRHPDFDELHNLLLKCSSWHDDDTTFTLDVLTIEHQYGNDDLIPNSPMARLIELAKHCHKSGYDWAYRCRY